MKYFRNAAEERADARSKNPNATTYITSFPCKRGHMDERYIQTGACATCARERSLFGPLTPIRRPPDNAQRRSGRAAAARRRNQTPRWLTKDDHALLEHMYTEAAEEQRFGGRACVEHIFPLGGKTVSGLHVPWNLRVVLGRAKSRRDPDPADISEYEARLLAEHGDPDEGL